MKKLVHITCPKCGHMINGRLWRCPECGGSDHKSGKIKKSHQKFWSRIIAALSDRTKKAA
jgi:predicted nucleic-acid-binding Zn-ribbon protein